DALVLDVIVTGDWGFDIVHRVGNASAACILDAHAQAYDGLVRVFNDLGDALGSGIGQRHDLEGAGQIKLYRRFTLYRTKRVGLPPVQGDLSFFAHARGVPRRIKHHVDRDILDAFDPTGGVFHPAGHFAGNRAAGSGQRHVDGQITIIVEVDLVDEAEFV